MNPTFWCCNKKNGYPGCLVSGATQGFPSWALEQQGLDRAMVRRKEGQEQSYSEQKGGGLLSSTGLGWKPLRAKGTVDPLSHLEVLWLCAVRFGVGCFGRVEAESYTAKSPTRSLQATFPPFPFSL